MPEATRFQETRFCYQRFSLFRLSAGNSGEPSRCLIYYRIVNSIVQGNCTQREHLMLLKAFQNEKHADVERGQNEYFDTLTLIDNYVETTIGWIRR